MSRSSFTFSLLFLIKTNHLKIRGREIKVENGEKQFFCSESAEEAQMCQQLNRLFGESLTYHRKRCGIMQQLPKKGGGRGKGVGYLAHCVKATAASSLTFSPDQRQ